MRQKISNILTKIFAVSTFVLVFAGGIMAIGFLAAFIVGGTAGENIASFIYKEIFGWIIFATSILIVIGWIRMEVNGEQELTAGEKKTKKKSKEEKK